MNRKITYFLFLLATLFVSTSAKAQADDLGFGGNGVAVGVALENFEPNTWYFLFQGRTTSKGAGSYAFPTVGEEVDPDGGLMTDMGENEDIKQLRAGDVPEGSYATDHANSLVRFVPVDGKEGAYNVQFGTGRWMTGPAGTGDSKTFQAVSSVYDAGEFNFYKVAEADDSDENRSTFGFNVYDLGQRVDNNAPGGTVVTWGSGEHTSIGNTNSLWSIVEVQWVEVAPMEIALRNLSDAITTYGEYADDFAVGNKPGLYSEEAVNALKEAIDKADVENNPDVDLEDYTVEDIEKMIEDIKAAYEAVLTTRVPLTVADGYYRFKNAMPYVQAVPVEGGEEGETEDVDVDKYMYTVLNGDVIYGMWGNRDDLSSDAASLWKITNRDGGLDIQNVGYESRFTAVKTSTNVVLSAESDSLMAIDPATTEDLGYGDVTYVNIRLASQAADNYFYLHQGGHGAVDGIGHNASGNLVGWSSAYQRGNGNPGASEWVLVPVSDADAQSIIAAFEPIKNRTAMLAAYDSIMTNAKQNLEIAIDDRRIDLITENSQFSSPWTEPREGSLNNLLDDNNTTFWHSNWSDGSVEGGLHYLQVDLVNPVDKEVQLYFARRNGAGNDHVTELEIFGSNDAEAEKEACESLVLFADIPFTGQTQTVTTDAFDTKGYRYLRLYANKTTNNRGYWHVSEVRLFYQQANEHPQSAALGDLFTNLQNVVAAQADLEEDQIQIEQYNALKQAYDAFMQKFVDPTELRQTLKDVDGKSAIIAIGTQPGFWADGSTGEALDKTIAEAQAYDAAGSYTSEQSTQYVETLKAQAEAIDAAAIKVQPSKWYKIRFATEEEFEDHEWDKVAGEEQFNSTIQMATSQDLFGKYITAATLYSEAVDGVTIYEVEAANKDELGLGSNLYLLAAEDNEDEDLALFRFVAVGDSAYLLQNKATGLFLKAAGTSGAVTLSAHPSLFAQGIIGYGLNTLPAKSITGEDQKFLHAQVLQNILVTWGPNFEPYAGSRSGFYIEEAGDVAADFTGEEFNVAVLQGTLTALCFPVDLSLKAGEKAALWSVESVADNTVTLTQIKATVPAGRPFILIQNEEYDPEAEDDETVNVVLKHANAVTALEPQTDHLLKGTFAQTKVGRGVLVANGNALVPTKASSATVAANRAYVADEEAYDIEATYALNLSDGADAIETIVASIARPSAIYTIDGRLVSRKGSINQLQRGVYVINGVKVVIK